MPRFTHTLADGEQLPLYGKWKHFYCSSSTAEILGLVDQETFTVKRKSRLRSHEIRENLRLKNTSGGSVTVSGFYGLEEFNEMDGDGDAVDVASMPDVTIASLPAVTIDTMPAVELAANDGLSASADVTVAVTAKHDFAAPAGAKAAVVTLVTAGFVFGEVRVSGSVAYAANTGIPLPVDGSGYYIDAGADLTVHNAHATNPAAVNVTWIS